MKGIENNEEAPNPIFMKENSYFMELNQRDVCEEVKALTVSLEEAMITLLAEKGEQAIGKSQFKKYTIDFYKEDGGMNKIQMQTPHSKGKKKDKRHFINSFIVGIGDTS